MPAVILLGPESVVNRIQHLTIEAEAGGFRHRPREVAATKLALFAVEVVNGRDGANKKISKQSARAPPSFFLQATIRGDAKTWVAAKQSSSNLSIGRIQLAPGFRCLTLRFNNVARQATLLRVRFFTQQFRTTKIISKKKQICEKVDSIFLLFIIYK